MPCTRLCSTSEAGDSRGRGDDFMDADSLATFVHAAKDRDDAREFDTPESILRRTKHFPIEADEFGLRRGSDRRYLRVSCVDSIA